MFSHSLSLSIHIYIYVCVCVYLIWMACLRWKICYIGIDGPKKACVKSDKIEIALHLHEDEDSIVRHL